jgi:hypothetical protein
MRAFVVALAAVAPALAAGALRAGETVSDDKLGLRLTVPDGFARDPARVKGKVIHTFHRPASGKEKFGTFIVVSRLGGLLGREKLDPKEFAAQSPRATLEGEKWKEFDIEVFRVPEEQDGVSVLTFNAQVPLKPEAVQVAVIGDADREDELRGVLRSTLDGLEGETNWLSTRKRVALLTEGVVRLALTVVVVAVIAVVIWRVVRKRRAGRGRQP